MIARKPIRNAGLLLALICAGAAQYAHGQCNNAAEYGNAAAPAPGNTVTITTFQYAGEYATITGVAAASVYSSTSSTATDYFTVRQGTPGGPVIAFGQQPLIWTSTVAGNYYIHCNTNAACGTQSTNRTTSLYAVPNAPMTFGSSAITQNDFTPVSKCNLFDQVIIGVKVVMNGNLSPMNITEFNLRLNLCTAPGADVATAKIYYTGGINAFATTNLFGSNPPPTLTPTAIFPVTGSQTLISGVNYFWVTFDLTPLATVNNELDAQCYNVTVAGVSQATIPKSIPGIRIIATCPPSPGGVPNNLLVWLKADAGVAVSGVNVTGWTNQSAATTTTQYGSPDRVNAGRNYNPIVQFTKSDGAYGGDFLRIPNSNVQSFFCAAQLLDPTRECTHMVTYDWVTTAQPCTGCAIHGGALGTGSANYGEYGYGNGNFQAPGVWRRNGDPSGMAYNTQHSGNFDIVTALGTGTGAANSLLGGQQNDGTFNGRKRDWLGPVGELVLYTGPISTAEANRVESYLAIKYGITLGGNGSTTLAYRSSASTLLWPANSGYHRDVIGIGRDDNSVLLQKQSRTPDDSTRIYLNTLAATNQANTGLFANNNSFVLAGHNTGKMCATAASNAEMPAGLYSRLEREWKVVNTNFPGTFNFAVRLNGCAAPGSVVNTDLRLLVDIDGNFTNAMVYAAGGGLSFGYSGGVITVTGISITHIPKDATRYITIGSLNATTPLPIELVSFTAECTGQDVLTSWTTASELNNADFTVERSTDGSNFHAVGSMAGTGTSSQMQQYAWTDHSPEPGVAYYRLRQTDFDGTSTWSPTVAVNCFTGEEFSIFMNPASDGFSFRYTPQPGLSTEVELRNVAGQLIWHKAYIGVSTGATQEDVSLKGVSEGIYFVRFKQGAMQQTLKLSVLK